MTGQERAEILELVSHYVDCAVRANHDWAGPEDERECEQAYVDLLAKLNEMCK